MCIPSSSNTLSLYILPSLFLWYAPPPSPPNFFFLIWQPFGTAVPTITMKRCPKPFGQIKVALCSQLFHDWQCPWLTGIAGCFCLLSKWYSCKTSSNDVNGNFVVGQAFLKITISVLDLNLIVMTLCKLLLDFQRHYFTSHPAAHSANITLRRVR